MAFLDSAGLSYYDSKLKNSINDYTTGINLLRGTRDFSNGSSDKVSNYFSDGFYRADKDTIYEIDEDGFICCGLDVPSEIRYLNATSYIKKDQLNGENHITFSYDVKFLNKDALKTTTQMMAVMLRNENGGTAKNIVLRLSNFGITPEDIVANKWYRLSCDYEVSGDYAFITVSTVVDAGITLRARKYKQELGVIENPIWSESPFDIHLADTVDAYNLGMVPEENRIGANANLNDYNNAGTYCCVANATVSSLSNIPSTLKDAFKLYVEYGTGGNTNYVKQWIRTYGAVTNDYCRYSNDGGNKWDAWKETYTNIPTRPIAGGGTGATTARGAQYNLLNDTYDASDGDVGDNTTFITRLQTPSATNGYLCTRSASNLWNWIKSKIKAEETPKGNTETIDKANFKISSVSYAEPFGPNATLEFSSTVSDDIKNDVGGTYLVSILFEYNGAKTTFFVLFTITSSYFLPLQIYTSMNQDTGLTDVKTHGLQSKRVEFNVFIDDERLAYGSGYKMSISNAKKIYL